LTLFALMDCGSTLASDPDRTGRSNLSNRSLFRQADEGQGKVTVATRRRADAISSSPSER